MQQSNKKMLEHEGMGRFFGRLFFESQKQAPEIARSFVAFEVKRGTDVLSRVTLEFHD